MHGAEPKVTGDPGPASEAHPAAPPILSVVLLTRNEAARLPDALAGVGWAEDLLVFDSESTDATPEVARRAGARVVSRRFTDFADQRNAALREARGEWVFFLDADERVSVELAAELQARAADPGGHDGFDVPRKNYLGARWLRHGGLYPDYQLRLVRRNGARFVGAVHERARLPGPIGRLQHPLTHHTYADREDLRRKVVHYAALEGKMHAAQGTSLARLLLRAPYRLLRTLVLRSGWRDGADGWIHAWAQWRYAWIVCATVRRERRRPSGAATQEDACASRK